MAGSPQPISFSRCRFRSRVHREGHNIAVLPGTLVPLATNALPAQIDLESLPLRSRPYDKTSRMASTTVRISSSETW